MKRHAAMAEPDRAEFDRRIKGDIPAAVGEAIDAFKAKVAAEKPSWATRKSSQEVLEVINPVLPDTVGGSADLTGSNNTKTASLKADTRADATGRYVYYGIREHAMAAAMNGMALHGGIIPYGGTFLVFTDYCRPSIRLAALMGLRVIYVMTHDSIGLGEDGPTHQPVEHLAALRAIPGLQVMRPADTIETAECWQLALESKKTPTVIALDAPEPADPARRRRRATSARAAPTSWRATLPPRSGSSPRARKSTSRSARAIFWPRTASRRRSCPCRHGSCSPRKTKHITNRFLGPTAPCG